MMEVTAQIAELLAFYKGLEKIEETNDRIVVAGPLSFEALPDGLAPISDTFEIEMLILSSYPDMLPKVRETGGKIDSDYEHVFRDGTLCLAVPIEGRRIFWQQPSLLGFVNKLVIPYLYGYCYWRKCGEHPFGERSHGAKGIVQHYVEALNLGDELIALSVIHYLYTYGYRGHVTCPCGSGLRARACHRTILLDLHRIHTQETLLHDLKLILDYCENKIRTEKIRCQNKLSRQIIHILHRSRGVRIRS